MCLRAWCVFFGEAEPHAPRSMNRKAITTMNFLDRKRAAFPARSASLYSLGVLLGFLLMVCGSVANAQSAALGGVVMDPSSAMVRRR